MEIYLKGERLDIYDGQDIELNFENFRFSEVFTDEWTTDIELPQSQKNIRLFEACGLLDHAGPIYNSPVYCQFMISDVSVDGYMHVVSLTKDTITVACYLSQIQFSLFNKDLSEYYPKDNDSSILRWDRFSTSMNYNNSNFLFSRYNYSHQYYSNIEAQYHPSIQLQYINALIENEENIVLPNTHCSWTTMATKKYLCPENKLQVFNSYLSGPAGSIGNRDIPLVGGQHISNDFQTSFSYKDTKWRTNWTDINYIQTLHRWVKNKGVREIRFNRSGKFHVKVYATCDRSDNMKILLYKNGHDVTQQYQHINSQVWKVTQNNANIQNFLSIAAYNVVYNAGDRFSFRLDYSGGAGAIAGDEVYVSVIMQHEGYTINQDDYGSRELQYIGLPYCFYYGWRSGTQYGTMCTYNSGSQGKGPSPEDYSYSYFGGWCNMPSITVRDWLTGLAWIADKKLKLNQYELSFVDAYQAKKIEGEITKISTATDLMAKNNYIKYKNDDNPYWFPINNHFLQYETTIFEAPFETSEFVSGMARINQYEFTNIMSDDSDDAWVDDIDVKFNEFDFIVFKQDNNILLRGPELSHFDLDKISTNGVTIQTYENCTDYDYVYLDGRKYMVMDGTMDTNTGLNEINCLEVVTKYKGHCVEPTITFSFLPSVYDCIINYHAYTSTGEGTIQMDVYSDIYMTQLVDTYYLSFSDNGFDVIAGLSANTQYWVSITAENECGETNVDGTFTTTIGFPPTVVINNVWNVDSSGATFSVGITDNSTI